MAVLWRVLQGSLSVSGRDCDPSAPRGQIARSDRSICWRSFW